MWLELGKTQINLVSKRVSMSIRCFKLHGDQIQLPIDAPTEIMTKMTPANDKLNLLSIQNLFQLQFKKGSSLHVQSNSRHIKILPCNPAKCNDNVNEHNSIRYSHSKDISRCFSFKLIFNRPF